MNPEAIMVTVAISGATVPLWLIAWRLREVVDLLLLQNGLQRKKS